MYIYIDVYIFKHGNITCTYRYTYILLHVNTKHMESYHSCTFEPLNVSLAPLRIERMVKAGWSWTDGCDVTMAGG